MGGVESNQRWATARNRKGGSQGDFLKDFPLETAPALLYKVLGE